jgi:MbtH protein
MTGDHENDPAFKVVVNHEEQYSLWPAGRANPPGWRDAGTRGTREECLAAVARAWTDLRPRSLRPQSP